MALSIKTNYILGWVLMCFALMAAISLLCINGFGLFLMRLIYPTILFLTLCFLFCVSVNKICSCWEIMQRDRLSQAMGEGIESHDGRRRNASVILPDMKTIRR